MRDISFSFASADDLDAVVGLLRECALPHEDIGEHLSGLIAAKRDKNLIGTVALEIYESVGLLRSLAVTEACRSHGLATELLTQIVTHARPSGVERLFLLTTTAQDFFTKRGFASFERTLVPGAIAGTEEFRTLCPGTATCMSKDISLKVHLE